MEVEYKNMDMSGWCECDGRPIEQACPVFHDDDAAPWDNCVLKHHYHCGVCKGIEQIG